MDQNALAFLLNSSINSALLALAWDALYRTSCNEHWIARCNHGCSTLFAYNSVCGCSKLSGWTLMACIWRYWVRTIDMYNRTNSMLVAQKSIYCTSISQKSCLLVRSHSHTAVRRQDCSELPFLYEPIRIRCIRCVESWDDAQSSAERIAGYGRGRNRCWASISWKKLLQHVDAIRNQLRAAWNFSHKHFLLALIGAKAHVRHWNRMPT